MIPNLPGEEKTGGVLPNVTPDAIRPDVPATWDDFARTSKIVFEYLAEGGPKAANKLISWINAERNKP